MKFDPEIEVLLEFARTAHEPPSAVRLQNLEAVQKRLGVPGATAPTEGGAGTAAAERNVEHTGVRTVASSPRVDTLTPLPASRPPRISSSLRQLVATGVVTGTVGVLIGFGLGQHASDTALEGQRLEKQRSEEHGAAAPTKRTETPSVISALESTPAASEQTAAARAGLTGADRAPQPPPSRAKVGRSPGKPGDTRTPKPIDRSFFVALRLLERARHALDVGEPTLGQSLLDELDERFPPDLLQEERLATRALGWCALGERGRAESAARKLLADNPRSIYAERLEQSCVSAPATGSK